MFVRDLLPCMYVLGFYLRRTYLRERLHVLAWRMQATARTDAVHCRSGCSALRLFLQTFATVPANVCNRPCKRLQPPSQTFAVKISFSHVFLLSRKF